MISVGLYLLLKMNNNFRNEINNAKILQKFEEVKKLTQKNIEEINNLSVFNIHENYNSEKGTYTVKESWIELDKNSGILKNGSYIRNPTARNLKDFILKDDKLFLSLDYDMNHGPMTGSLKFVIDEKGNVILGFPEPDRKNGLHYFHPTLIGGINPEVISAGQIDFVNGKTVLINNVSGHFKPYSTTSIIIKIAFQDVPKSEGYFNYYFTD